MTPDVLSLTNSDDIDPPTASNFAERFSPGWVGARSFAREKITCPRSRQIRLRAQQERKEIRETASGKSAENLTNGASAR